MKNLWIDDLRTPPEGWDWAKSSAEAIILLKDNLYETVSFDHGLGGHDTAMLVVTWMSNVLTDNEWPSRVLVHSANPVGARNLYNAITRDSPASTTVSLASVLSV